MRPPAKQKIERLFSVADDRDPPLSVELAQRAYRELYLERIVLDQEDVRRGSGNALKRGGHGSWMLAPRSSRRDGSLLRLPASPFPSVM